MRRHPRLSSTRPSAAFIAAFLAPAFLIYTVFVLLPAFNAFRYSFTRWDGLSDPVPIGGKNYADIAKSGDVFVTALMHNLYLMTVGGLCVLALSLFFAYTLHRGIKGARLFRIAFFFPNVISSVAVAILWTLVYSSSKVGVLNAGLMGLFGQHGERMGPLSKAAFATDSLPVAFLGKSHLLTSVPPIMVWGATGFYMVLFLAAMENIPETFYEAARLDGASNGKMFFTITLPMMWDVLTTGIVFIVINGLKLFDLIWVLEYSRPSKETHTIATLMYQKVFEEYNIGYGTAVAVCLFVLVLLATMVSFRLLKRERLEY